MFLINRGTSEFQKVKSQYITKIIFFFLNFFCGKRLQVQRQTIVAVCAKQGAAPHRCRRYRFHPSWNFLTKLWTYLQNKEQNDKTKQCQIIIIKKLWNIIPSL